jgi:hypothetical protein
MYVNPSVAVVASLPPGARFTDPVLLTSTRVVPLVITPIS